MAAIDRLTRVDDVEVGKSSLGSVDEIFIGVDLREVFVEL